MAKKKTEIDITGIKQAVREMVENAVDSVDFKRLTYDSAGKPLIEGISAAIRDNAFMASDAMKTVMEELDLQLQLGAIDTEKYYKYIEAYRNSFFEKGSSGWWEYTLKILEYEGIMQDGQLASIQTLAQNMENEKNRIIGIYDELISQASASVGELERSALAMKNKLDSVYKPYSTQKFKIDDDSLVFENGAWIRKGSKTYTKTELNNLNETVTQLQLYADLLNEIKNKGGVPADFFRYLRDLPFEEGITLSSLLLQNDAAALDDYVKSWQALQDTQASTTASLFSDELEALKNDFGSIGEDLTTELTTAFGTLPDTFFENGKLSAQKFGKGFTGRLYSVISEINEIIARYTADITLEPQTASYTASYNFYNSNQTVSQQLAEARLSDTLNSLRK